jgi:glycerol-3-phosphate acyltransferase PlsY
MYYVIAAVLGYLMGNISSSYFFGKLFKNIDIRQHGSGNAGATNTFRVLGFKAGLIVFLLDVSKGILAALIGGWITGSLLGAVAAGCGAVIGHNWPFVLGFRGGKGIATSLGMMIAVFPKISVILFVLGVVIVFITRYVSLASITAAILFPVLLLIFREPVEALIVGIVVSALAIYSHRANIIRLLKGKENRIAFRLKSRKKVNQ